jgi:hypothetical protein
MFTLFTIAALIGGTVLAFQFVLMLLGMGEHHGGDFTDAGGVDLATDAGAGHLGGDVPASDHGAWHDASGAHANHSFGHWFYEILSLRTLSAGVTFFGLAGITALAYDYSDLGAFVLATVAGLGAMYAVYWLFKQVYRLQHTGTENIRNAVGAPAVVYVPIPGKRAGAGKVTFRLQNRLVEYQAVTEDDERLVTGEKVVVVAIVNADTVRVARSAARVPDMAATS